MTTTTWTVDAMIEQVVSGALSADAVRSLSVDQQESVSWWRPWGHSSEVVAAHAAMYAALDHAAIEAHRAARTSAELRRAEACALREPSEDR